MAIKKQSEANKKRKRRQDEVDEKLELIDAPEVLDEQPGHASTVLDDEVQITGEEDNAMSEGPFLEREEIGRASCRERVC